MSIGGSRPGIIGLTDVVEIFDPSSMSWSSGPALPEQVYGPTVVSCSGDVLMFGGDSAGSIVDRVYGLSSQGTWTVSP